VFGVVSKGEGDVLLHAGTGKGKTLSYLLPLANQLYEGDENLKVALVQPNGLLKAQIKSVVDRLVPDFSANFRICTPRQLKDADADVCVVDEADLSLSAACLPPKMKLSEFLRVEMGGKRRAIYAGATFPLESNSRSIRAQILHYNKATQVIEDESVNLVDERVAIRAGNEHFIKVNDKVAHLREILEANQLEKQCKVIVFVRDKPAVVELMRQIKDLFPADKRANLVVTTDSMSRGIDLTNLQHVVHFSPPMSAIDYVHRVGRLNRLNSQLSPEQCHSFCLLNEADLSGGAPVYLKYLMQSRDPAQITDISRLFGRNRSINKKIRRGKFNLIA
jgi:superfamily II DNA/RNA helicase